MRATRAAALAAERQRLGSRLWKVGVLVRLITLLNGLLLVGTASYMVWREVSLEEEEGSKEAGTKHSPFEGMLPDQVIEHLPANVVLRTVLRRSMAILAGVAMIALEVWTAAAEGATRAALGLAFGPGGRFCLFCLAALLCAPMVLSPPRPPPPRPPPPRPPPPRPPPPRPPPPPRRAAAALPARLCRRASSTANPNPNPYPDPDPDPDPTLTAQMDLEHSLEDGYVSCGAVGVTLVAGLLQALLLCCFPAYRTHCVADLDKDSPPSPPPTRAARLGPGPEPAPSLRL